MSIRFLKKDNTVGITDDIKGLFNPLINDNFSGGPSHRKWKDIIAILNTLFCKENFESNTLLKYFMFDGTLLTDDECTLVRRWTNAIPDDQRYQLAFLRRNRSFTDNSFSVTFINGFSSKDIGSSYLNADFKWESFNPVDSTPDNFKAVLDATHTIWHAEIFAHRNTRPGTCWPYNYVPVGSSCTTLFLKYSSCLDIVTTINGPSTPYYVAELLEIDSSNYTVEFHAFQKSVKLRLTNNVTKTNRRAIHNVLNYSTDVLSILPYPNHLKKERDPILIGVELEISTDYTAKDLVEAAEDPFFLAKHDGSLSGNKSRLMELVTAPSSFKYLKRQYALWFNKLDYDKFDTTVDTNNGMHVHVGRTHFEDNTHIRNFCWFFNNPANYEFLLYISERTRDSLNRWAPTYTFPSSYSRTKAFRDIYHVIGHGFRGITNFKGGWESATTIEVRMFRGIVSYAAIVKNLEFVEAVFHFTKGLTSYREMTLKSFLCWLKTQPNNKYILLRKFIEQGKIGKMLLAADVKDLLFNENDPDKVVKLLNKAPFKLTNNHISYLNKGKKRIYVLDKATGTVSVTYTNKSKLAPLDKSFAERYLRDITPAA